MAYERLAPWAMAGAGAASTAAPSALARALADNTSSPADDLFAAYDGIRKNAWWGLGKTLGLDDQEIPQTGADLMNLLYGADREDPLTKALGFGAEVLGDPMNLLFSPLSGYAGLKRGQQAVGGLLGRTDDLARVAGEAAPLARAQETVGGVMRGAELPSHLNVGYRPEVMDAMPGIGELANPQRTGLRTYNRVDAPLAEALDSLGGGYSLPGGGAFVYDKPGYARGVGGTLKLTEGAPKIEGGFMGSLAGEANRQPVDLLNLPAPAAYPPLTQALPPAQVNALEQQLPGLTDVVAGEGGWGRRQRGLADLPADEAMRLLQDRLYQNKLTAHRWGPGGTGDATLGPLERFLDQLAVGRSGGYDMNLWQG